MPNNNETTTKFKVDISELKKSMQEARKQVAYANSEFKEASSSMDDWSKSSDGISAKLKQLNSNLDSQEKVLREYEKTLEEVKKEYGENSAEALDYATKLNNQRAVVNKTKKEIANYEDALQEVSEAEKIASKTGKDVADVLADMGKEAEEAGDGFTVLKGAVATFAGNVLTGLANGLKNGISSLMTLASETREYRTELGKLETAFTTAGFSTETATETYKDLYAVLGDEGQTVEAVNMLAKLAETEENLAEWTTIATGVYGTFGNSLPIESLTEAANETAKTGALTGSLADALNWAGVSEDDFQASLDGCTTEQERQALITETLNGLYSDAAKKYEETNKSVMDANRANSDYTDTLAEMGAKIEPVTTSLKTGFTGLLQELLKLVSDVDMTAFTAKIEEGFAVLKDDVLPAVKDGLGWILENKDAIIAGLAGIATGFVAFKVASLIQGVTAAMQGMTIAQYALNLAMNLNPIGIVIALLAGLVAAFITLWNNSESFRGFWIGLWENIKSVCSKAIDAIVNFFTVTMPQAIDKMVTFLSQLPSKVWKWLLNTINKVSQWSGNMISKAKETASNFVNKIIEWVSGLPSKVWTWLLNAYNKVSQWGSNMLSKAKETASNFVNKILEWVKTLPSRVFDWLSSTLRKVTSWGSDLVSKGKQSASNLVTGIVNTIKDLPSKFISVGSDVIGGLWSGISGAIGGLYSNIKNSLSGLVDKAKNALGIHSPSKVFADEVGKWIPEGIAVGISKNAKSALNAMKDLTADSLVSAKAGLSTGGVTGGVGGAVKGGVVNNFYQTINSPKQLSRLDIYRQSKNLLGYAGGGL